MDRKKSLHRTTRDIQAEKSKQKIYDTAIQLFSQKGFEETKITEICSKSSCSVGAFYHHYPSKESILEETFRKADEDFITWRPGKDNYTGRELIMEYVKTYADLIDDMGLDFSKVFYSNRNKNFIKEGRPMQTILTELIERAVDENRISLRITPEKACDMIFISIRGSVFHWCLHEGKFPIRTAMYELVDTLLRGMEDR
ncbi:MAG: TetR/AcrR family transcriptional regulator [Spirochaetales bacterium]|nr:TetR/AcrR family transcriptional regulator [Spirochaetales bacterium]